MKINLPKSIAMAIVALCGLTAMLALAGCGDSSSEASSLTKAQFIKQADAICTRAEKEKGAKYEAFILRASSKSSKPLTSKQGLELVEAAILPALQVQVDELNSLGTPDGDEKASAILDEFDEVVGELEDEPKPLTETKNDPFEKVAGQAKKYGFKTCILYY